MQNCGQLTKVNEPDVHVKTGDREYSTHEEGTNKPLPPALNYDAPNGPHDISNAQVPSELPPDSADKTSDTEGEPSVRETSSQEDPGESSTENNPWERKIKTTACKRKIGSNDYALHLKGPNAKTEASLSKQGFESMAQAEVGQMKIKAGKQKMTAGLGAYTNANAGFKMDGSFNIGSGVLDIVDNYDRDAKTYTDGTYAESGTYAVAFNDKPGERVPKAGAYAGAGVGRARAEYSILEAEAKGPNAGAGAHANILGVEAIARAEIGSASASAGPLQLRAALGVDTGVRLGVEGLELKLLGTGFNIGQRPSLSLLGSEISCCIQ